MNDNSCDAVVVGSGPNGLEAALTIARHGLRVLRLKAETTIWGVARTDELTLPGFRHEVSSAVHPLGVGSPLFRNLPLEGHRLRWVHLAAPLAHPLERSDGATVVLKHSVAGTAKLLAEDERANSDLIGPLAESTAKLAPIND